MVRGIMCSLFFFNDTATTEIYTLSLHDALPISAYSSSSRCVRKGEPSSHSTGIPGSLVRMSPTPPHRGQDRKSTRLNSSHANISYAVFCLKKKKTDFIGDLLVCN